MNSAHELLKLIESKQLFPLFQPIIDTAEEHIIGYEALIRGPQGHLEFLMRCLVPRNSMIYCQSWNWPAAKPQ